MALMLNEKRHANCIAVTAVKCLTLNREKFDLLMGQVRQPMAKRMRIRILQSVPLLAKLSESKLLKLASVMKVQSFSDGTYIIKEGEQGSRFYIINEGEVRLTFPGAVSKGGVGNESEVRLSPHEFFGERALVTNEKRTANVIACGTVECLVLDRNSFQILLLDVQDDITEEIKTRDCLDSKRRGSDNSDKQESETYVHIMNYKLEDLIPTRTVGAGTFGRVKLVQHAIEGGIYALKCMNKAVVVSLHQERNTLAEKNLLYECSQSVFVMKLLQTFNAPNQIFMLTEFIQGGELWSYIYEKKKVVPRAPEGGFDMSSVKFYTANVILAFRHIHSKGIAYRDLKPENLLLNDDGYLKVIDFGFAKKLPYFKRGAELDKTYTLVRDLTALSFFSFLLFISYFLFPITPTLLSLYHLSSQRILNLNSDPLNPNPVFLHSISLY
jgi:CRP-like cAMP-binding protein